MAITYELRVLAASSLLGTVSTSAKTNDSDRGAVETQERANNGDFSNDTQETLKLVHVGRGSLPEQDASVSGHVAEQTQSMAYLVGALAALGYTVAADITTTGNSLGSGHDQRREGHNWQKESRCTEEHFA